MLVPDADAFRELDSTGLPPGIVKPV